MAVFPLGILQAKAVLRRRYRYGKKIISLSYGRRHGPLFTWKKPEDRRRYFKRRNAAYLAFRP